MRGVFQRTTSRVAGTEDKRTVMEHSDESGTATALLRGVGDNANAATVAHEVVSRWKAIEIELGGVIGTRGVAGLYQHGLRRVARSHPWLTAALDENLARMDLEALDRVLAAQSDAEAIVGGRALLQTFYDLLANLIGAPLTERLLRPVLTDSTSAKSAQGTLP